MRSDRNDNYKDKQIEKEEKNCSRVVKWQRSDCNDNYYKDPVDDENSFSLKLLVERLFPCPNETRKAFNQSLHVYI